MRLSYLLLAGLSACSGSSASSTSTSPPAAPPTAAPPPLVRPAPNGIAFPVGYQEWATIAVSHRTDNGTLRAILGNDAAIAAVRAGATSPWPDGVALGKVVWKETHLDLWDQAIVPEALVHAEFMFKDSARYVATGGWGFARWKGMEQTPYGEDESFVDECFGCHQPAAHRDYVFTRPAPWPH